MIYLNTRFQRKCLLKKQGLRQTQKLRQYTNWKVNVQTYELAIASNIENWSVQLVCLIHL